MELKENAVGTMKWCTYKSTHSTGFYYLGKGQTAKVQSGTYKGSGTVFKLATTDARFSLDTWTTVILDTFVTEDEAYSAEEALVPLSLLADPFCLNQTEGGRKGKYRNRTTLLRSITNAKKAISREKKKARERAKSEEIRNLKKVIRRNVV